MIDFDITLTKLLLIILIYVNRMLANIYFDPRDLATSATPCTFPVPRGDGQWHKCNLEPTLAEKYRICDPESSIYWSQIESLIAKLDQIAHKHQSECICDLHDTESNHHESENFNDHKIERRKRSTMNDKCWYKFSFAFVDHLRFPKTPISDDIHYEDLCEKLDQSSINKQSAQLQNRYYWSDRKNVENYGRQFVNFLSKRWWPRETCEGNILILIVKNTKYHMQGETRNGKPMISVNFSPFIESIAEGFGAKLHDSVDQANILIKRGRREDTTEKILVNMITSIDNTLTSIYDSFYNTPVSTSTKRALITAPSVGSPSLQYNHSIPNWALGAFAGCGLLLLLMATGVLWSKKRVRRPGLNSRKQVLRSDSRRWKVGFVGGMFNRSMRGAPNSGDANFSGVPMNNYSRND